MSPTRFSGTDRYVATDDLMMAVNAAVTLGRPLLIKGEPGTGKTQLAATKGAWQRVVSAVNHAFQGGERGRTAVA